MPDLSPDHDQPLSQAAASRNATSRDNEGAKPHNKWIEEDAYAHTVLRLPANATEDEIDESLAREARGLGIIPTKVVTNIESITSSLSATTVSSDLHQGSIISQSTAPTSCASSEYRPGTSLSGASLNTPNGSAVPSILSDIEKKRYSGLRSGFRRMAGFRKRRSVGSASASLASIDSDAANSRSEIRTSMSMTSPTKSHGSLGSDTGDFSNQPSTAKTSYESEPVIDKEALQRSLDCKEMLNLRSQQLDEKSRFLDYRDSLISQVRRERDRAKAEKTVGHKQDIADQEEKNEKAVEQLEARHLEEELKIEKEHDTEKRAVMTRLRYMEAYCQNPTPPPSPADTSSGRRSMDSATSLPLRHITKQHYENLAQQYHKRDTMESLHEAQINVLRGKQKRAVENFMMKRDREIEQMEKLQHTELDAIDIECGKQESEIRSEFEPKRLRLEARWKLQALIEKTKKERSTGLKYEALPNMVAVQGRA